MLFMLLFYLLDLRLDLFLLHFLDFSAVTKKFFLLHPYLIGLLSLFHDDLDSFLFISVLFILSSVLFLHSFYGKLKLFFFLQFLFLFSSLFVKFCGFLYLLCFFVCLLNLLMSFHLFHLKHLYSVSKLLDIRFDLFCLNFKFLLFNSRKFDQVLSHFVLQLKFVSVGLSLMTASRFHLLCFLKMIFMLVSLGH